MEKFAERYCKDNPDVFKSADGAYLLSFALIMLNTDAHNPMADKKLSLEDFVSMCQYQVTPCCVICDTCSDMQTEHHSIGSPKLLQCWLASAML